MRMVLYDGNIYFYNYTQKKHEQQSLLCFYIGILIRKYWDSIMNRKMIVGVSFIIFTVLSGVHISANKVVAQAIFVVQGIALLILLLKTGERVMRYPIRGIIEYVARLSYCIFLTHHVIIVWLLQKLNRSLPDAIILLLSLTMIFIVSQVVFSLTQFVLEAGFIPSLRI